MVSRPLALGVRHATAVAALLVAEHIGEEQVHVHILLFSVAGRRVDVVDGDDGRRPILLGDLLIAILIRPREVTHGTASDTLHSGSDRTPHLRLHLGVAGLREVKLIVA